MRGQEIKGTNVEVFDRITPADAGTSMADD